MADGEGVAGSAALEDFSSEDSKPGNVFVVPGMTGVKRRHDTGSVAESAGKRRRDDGGSARFSAVKVKEQLFSDDDDSAAEVGGGEKSPTPSPQPIRRRRRTVQHVSPSPARKSVPAVGYSSTPRSGTQKLRDRLEDRRSSRAPQRQGGSSGSSQQYLRCTICGGPLLPGQALARGRLHQHASCAADRRSERDFFAQPGKEEENIHT